MTPQDAVDLVAKAKRFHLVLAPSCKAFANLRPTFLDQGDVVLSVEEVLRADALVQADLVMITGIEAADRARTDATNLLAPLRERVTQLIEAGSSVILLSKYPKMRYPDVPGSSLLQDASDFHPRTRAVATDDHPLLAMPAWADGVDEVDFLTELVSELGTPLVARLDQVLFESPLRPSEALSDLASPELDALYFAGLVIPSGDTFAWTIPRALDALKAAVANTLASTTSPPRDLALTYEYLWKIERRARSALRAKAIQTWGNNWKDSLTNPTYSQRVFDRAGEVAYPGVRRVTNIRDPLEWLSLGELLALREEKPALGDLGMPVTHWRRLAIEVMPIRNQVSHMRLTKPGDLVTLKQWDAVLARFLNG